MIWRGYGAWAIVAILLVAVGFDFAVGPIPAVWVQALTLWLIAGVVCVGGYSLNRKADREIGTPSGWLRLFDHSFAMNPRPKTIAELAECLTRKAPGHSVFWVRVEVWGILPLLLGLLMVLR